MISYYENISVGVKNNIYDVQMIKDSQRSMIIAIYKQAEPFIKRIREQNRNQKLYIEFEDFINILKS